MSARQQAEEGLRRALAVPTEPDPHTIARLLRGTAGALAAYRPAAHMDPEVREFYAEALAAGHAGDDSALARATEKALLAAMPEPYPTETRGEYAIRLRAAAGTGR